MLKKGRRMSYLGESFLFPSLCARKGFIYQDQWEKMWGSPALKILSPSFLNSPSSGPRGRSPSATPEAALSGINPALASQGHLKGEGSIWPTNNGGTPPNWELPEWRLCLSSTGISKITYDWIAQWSHMCTQLPRRGTGGVLRGGRESPSLRATSSWRGANFWRPVASWNCSSLGCLSIT